MIRLIAFNGQMGSGKSEAIKTLTQITDREVVLVKFAGKLYEIQEYIYNLISPAYQRPANFVKDRKLLQWLGTEWGRGLDENLWVNLWKAEVEKQFAAGKLVVCDDVRFDNEAELVKSLGGTIIQIISNRTAERIDVNAGIKNHASEAGIKHEFVDVILENNGSLEDYKNSLTYLYNKLGVGDSTPTEGV